MVRLKDCTFFMGHGFEYLLGFSGKYDFVIDFFLAKGINNHSCTKYLYWAFITEAAF